jgi:hypothetical protein
MESWASKYADAAILSTDGGPIIFYPFGFLRGYVVPDEESKSRIRSLMLRLGFVELPMGLCSIAVDFGLRLAFGTTASVLFLFGAGFFHSVCHWAAVRGTTKQLVSLPFGLGFRLYALWCDDQRLRTQVSCGLLFAMFMIVAIVFTGFDLLKAVSVVAFLLVSMIAGALLYTRNQEGRESA